jgi:hypothetical protein
MMRLVVDTNQARLIPSTIHWEGAGRVTGLTLPPYILAEILLRGAGPRRDTLERLRSHNIRIGLEPAVLTDRIAGMSASQIETFEPFHSPNDDHDALRPLLYEDRLTVSPAAQQWARETKDARLRISRQFIGQSKRARDSTKENRARRVRTFGHALLAMEASGSALKSFVYSLLSHEGRKPPAISGQDEFYQAVVANVYLRHFFHGWLFYTLSLSRMWADQTLNRDPSASRDDIADLFLGLYVGPKDIVVTGDRLLRDVFAMIDPAVKVVSAAALTRSQ